MSEFAVRAIDNARAGAQARRELACESCAAWVLETAWMFTDSDFEDHLVTHAHLLEVDRDVFREFRAELLEERAA